MTRLLVLAVVSCSIALLSCTSSEYVRTGSARAALLATERVEFFQSAAAAPGDIVEIGLLQLEGKLKTENGIIEQARKKARAMGGNCIVLLRTQTIPNEEWFTTHQYNFVVGYSGDVARLGN